MNSQLIIIIHISAGRTISFENLPLAKYTRRSFNPSFVGLLPPPSATRLSHGLVSRLLSRKFMCCHTEIERGDHDTVIVHKNKGQSGRQQPSDITIFICTKTCRL